MLICYHCKRFNTYFIKKTVKKFDFRLCTNCVRNTKCFCGNEYDDIKLFTGSEEPKLRFLCNECIDAVHF